MPTISNSSNSSSSSMSVASATNGAILQLLLSALTGAARTNNPFEIPVYNDLAHQRFNVSLAIGTPPRAYNVLLDSGSTSAWVPIVNTTGCAPNCPWTYDPTSSSTISKTNETFLNLYGTGGEIRVEGSWYKDNVSVGGLPALRDAAFAIADFPKPFYDQGNRGILGMGCRFIEYGPDGPSPIPFAPLWQRISKAASSGRSKFAMWLNAPNAASGTIQFGSEDSSKHRGKLLSVRINEDAPGVISDWNITLTGVVRGRVGLQGRPKKQLITPTNYTLPVILDSGAPNLYIPTSLYTPIADGLNATENINGSPWVPCSLRKPETGFLEFQFATSNAGELVKIRVTYESIIYPPGFPVTVPPLPDQNGEKMCYLGIVPFDGFVRLLGAPFLRSAYTVFDLDNKEIRMAQARWAI